jgi:hypothetical protein
MSRTRLFASLLVLILALPAIASDEEPEVQVASDKEAKHELQMFDRGFDTEDIDFKLDAVIRLGKCVHEDVAKVLFKLLVRDPDPYVQMEAAKGLANQTPFAKDYVRKLARLMEDDDLDPMVLAQVIRTLGKFRYTRVWEEIADLVSHEKDVVTIACFDVLGEWKELRAWYDILMFWEAYPTEGTWSTGTVRVDTGAAGTKDARAAKAKWHAKYGSRVKQRARPDCVKALKAAVKEITGVELKSAEEFREWLDVNERKVKEAERKRD